MILSFNGRVNIAVSKVLEKFQNEKFLEVQGTVSSGGQVSSPDGIDRIKVVFWNPENDTVVIDSTGFAEFGEPRLVREEWMESSMFDFADVKMDVNEALKLKASAGY